LVVVTVQVALNEIGSSLESTVTVGVGTTGLADIVKMAGMVVVPSLIDIVAAVFETVRTTGTLKAELAPAAVRKTLAV
jgi:hypothetical protein